MSAIKFSDRVTLTTDHPLSSYGVPVAIIDGEARNSEDTINSEFSEFYDEADTAMSIVERCHTPVYLTGTLTPATDKDAMYIKFMAEALGCKLWAQTKAMIMDYPTA